MEKRFKVYVYDEGEPLIVHCGPCKNIYSIEDQFIEQLEMLQPRQAGVRMWDPNLAHAYFLPVSVLDLRKYVYEPHPHSYGPLIRTFEDYVQVVKRKHPFQNRNEGADHFMLVSHDWGPYITEAIPELYSNSIRPLCNANTFEGFIQRKDISIPRIHLCDGSMAAQLTLGLLPGLGNRMLLAFFAGGCHGPGEQGCVPVLILSLKDETHKRKPVIVFLLEQGVVASLA